MELRQYFNVILKWWWLIAISVLVAAGASYLGSRSTPKNWQSRTTLMVGQPQATGGLAPSYVTGPLAQFYSDLARREPVLKAALNALQLEWDWGTLQNMVTSRVVPNTPLLEIAVLDTDPVRAQVLTTEIANQLILQSSQSENPDQVKEKQFIRQQISDLRGNIEKANEEVRLLDDTIAQSKSARQIQEARARQDSLRAQISTWQATYAQLSSNLQSGSINELSVVEPARYGTEVGPSTALNVLMAAAIGLVLAAGAAFLLEYLDDSLKTSDDVTGVVGLPTLGQISPIDGSDAPNRLIAIHQPRSPACESYRMLRTSLQFCGGDRAQQTVLITSASPEEGKSITAANLAIVMSQAGANVLLIDADLRRPTQHELFELDNNVGLSLLLSKNPMPLMAVVQNSTLESLKVITSGPLPPNPSELLGSKRMVDVIESVKTEFEFVVVDSPPVLSVADASILATRVDTTILVIEAGRTRRDAARRSKEALVSVGADIAGVLLNRVAQHGAGYSYYYGDVQHNKPADTSPLKKLRGLLGGNNGSRRASSARKTDQPPATIEPQPDQIT